MKRLTECRQKVCNLFKNKNNAAILINSAKQIMEEHNYYQDPNFYYLFGDPGPNCWGGMLLNNNECKCTLFVSNDYLEPHYKHAYGDRRNEWMKNCDCVIKPQKDIIKWIKDNNIHILYQLSDTLSIPGLGLSSMILNGIQYNKKVLPKILNKSRIIKTVSELEILRKINKISSDAHNIIRESILNGQMKNENDVECLFNYLVQKESKNRLMAYPCICASGPRSCIIHYMKNNNNLINGQMILMDMGGRLNGYISDITQTVLIGGSDNNTNNFQNLIYQLVLQTHNYIINQLKSGINWVDMEILCRKLLLNGLMPLFDPNEIKKESNFDNIMHEIMPHWLGHNIGLQVHDCGDLYNEDKILKSGMTLAIEPGIYISPTSIKYFKPEIKNYLNYFGVRIESNVIIHDNFAENITTVIR